MIDIAARRDAGIEEPKVNPSIWRSFFATSSCMSTSRRRGRGNQLIIIHVALGGGRMDDRVLHGA